MRWQGGIHWPRSRHLVTHTHTHTHRILAPRRVLGDRGAVDPATVVQRVSDAVDARARVQEEAESSLTEAREEAALARAEVEAAQRKRKALVEECGGFADDLLAAVQRACEEYSVDPAEPHQGGWRPSENPPPPPTPPVCPQSRTC